MAEGEEAPEEESYSDGDEDFDALMTADSRSQMAVDKNENTNTKSKESQGKDAGADDVLLVPTTTDPDDVHRVADILG